MNILLCTLGESWAVIPEVYGLIDPAFDLYAHHPEKAQLAALREEHALQPPDEIWVATSEGDRTRTSLRQLSEWWRLLAHPCRLRVWSARGTDQLASQAECEHFRELAFRLALKARDTAEGGQLLFSLAGGRKTMSADLQRAAHLFGAHRLLHVVDNGRLPERLFRPEPDLLTRPLPADLIGDGHRARLMPLVVGGGSRNELLDIEIEGRPRIAAGSRADEPFWLPLCESGREISWPLPQQGTRLHREIDWREGQGGALLGNYLNSLALRESHENWRQLYRLPSRLIDTLRQTPLAEGDRDWLKPLPKADLHRHLGGSLDLEAQRRVARSVWAAMTPAEQQAATRTIQPLIDQRDDWAWNWPDLLRNAVDEPAERRSQRAAALLLKAEPQLLKQNLWGVTEPRCALNSRHPWRFAAYERPGELTGSAILQHEAALEPYAAALLQQAIEENLAYLELRGSPQKYLGGNGEAFLKQFESALQKARLEHGLAEGEGPLIRFILIVDRRSEEPVIRRVVELAVQTQGEFVVGLDLAGDEHHNPEQMAHWFAPAFEACLPITIHAGEGQRAENIWKAAYHLHADRIGHGLTLLDQPELHRRFQDRGLCLELCPTSNREVVGYRDPAHPASEALPPHPAAELWQAGLGLTLCTDNPGISRTTLADEYGVLARMNPGSLTRWDALAMIRQGFNHAFLPHRARGELMKRVDHRIYQQLLAQTDAAERFTPG